MKILMLLLLVCSLPTFAAQKNCADHLANGTRISLQKAEGVSSELNLLKGSEVYQLGYKTIDGKEFLFISSFGAGRLVYQINGRTPVADGNNASTEAFDLDIGYAGYLEEGPYASGYWLFRSGKFSDEFPAARRHTLTATVRADFDRQTGKMSAAVGSIDMDVGNQKFYVRWQNANP